MNQDRLFTTLALAATLAFSIPAVQAEHLSPSFEAKLQAAADGGLVQVNHLLYRTRAVYNLSMEEALQHVQFQPAEASIDGGGAATAEASIDEGGERAPEEGAMPSPNDGFASEFFRNDPRD